MAEDILDLSEEEMLRPVFEEESQEEFALQEDEYVEEGYFEEDD